MPSIIETIAQELSAQNKQVEVAISLLDEGSTVPFIARYRKEATGGLDDIQLRTLSERLQYLRELDDRRESVLASIEEQGKLTPALQKQIADADTKTRLEDLYLPYKKKRRTKGEIAKEAGLEALANTLFENHALSPEVAAEPFVSDEKGVADVAAALEGAKFILMERFAEQADLIAKIRKLVKEQGRLQSRVAKGKEQEGQKYEDYFEYDEAYVKIPPHRALALFRGRREGILSLKLDVGDFGIQDSHPCEQLIATTFDLPYQPAAAVTEAGATRWLTEVVRWTWKIKLLMQVETDLLGDLRELAEAEAINVFALNLKDLLLAPPAGQRATLGLDPGLRTGVKVAVVDATGQLCDHATIYPHAPKNQWDQSIHTLAQLCEKHAVELIAIGNGTASRETEKLAAELIAANKQLRLDKVLVSEAGASVYSASEFASREFPELDVSIRGAVSIARRLQDPLAELVKIEPQSIGVGQYQHDLSTFKLSRALDGVVEDCVNGVGVELNTASAPLLARVSGLNETQAANIVEWRNSNGRFQSREDLKKVTRLGDKTFEQAAGFLRIRGGDDALDASAVHPESYSLVRSIADKQGCTTSELMGNKVVLKSVRSEEFASESVGALTINDILQELEKPGRDPRPEFRLATFKEGVEKLSDLKADMILEGTVSNVTNFGAFVDIGVHQDGLVHISALADKFVKDPREVVKTGDIVKVKVMSVDAKRKRIGLTMRLSDSAADLDADNPRSRPRSDRHKSGKPNNSRPNGKQPARGSKSQEAKPNGAFAAAFAAAKQK
ncbi:MAG: Tex family protein [Pseudomonadales bacterium]